jgi:hypothetical protein
LVAYATRRLKVGGRDADRGIVGLLRGWLKEMGFGRSGGHVIEVPAGPDGRPGERVLAPSASMHPPWPPGPDGSRSDFRVFLGRRGTSFGAVCLGTTRERGEPEAAAHKAAAAHRQRGLTALDAQPDLVAGEASWRVRVEFPRGTLTDWLFAHRGWLFAAGVLHRPADDESKMLEGARAVLASWTWCHEPTVAGPPS